VTLAEARRSVDRAVVYAPRHGAREVGVITSVGDVLVFVRYGSDATAKATRAEDLVLAEAEA
jgi:hypothetical protein